MTTDENPTTAEPVSIPIERLHEINERFNAFLAKKARSEGRMHTKYQKIIDVDCLEWAAKARAGLLTESQLPSKLPVKEEDCPISERTGKRKLAVWCPLRQTVTGYVSEDDDEPFVKGADKLLEITEGTETLRPSEGEEVPELACPSYGSADLPHRLSETETSDPSNTPRD